MRPSAGAAGLGAGETWYRSGAFGAEPLLLPRTAALRRLNTYAATSSVRVQRRNVVPSVFIQLVPPLQAAGLSHPDVIVERILRKSPSPCEGRAGAGPGRAESEPRLAMHLLSPAFSSRGGGEGEEITAKR